MKPSITIVGPGNLGTALAKALHQAGYSIAEVVFHGTAKSRQSAKRLAAEVAARPVSLDHAGFQGNLVWLCVPDRAIARTAISLADKTKWTGKIVFHSSGALLSSELAALKKRGAAVAAVHPLMTFVRGTTPNLERVPFAMEGDARAKRVAEEITRNLGGEAFTISAQDKALYHVWGAILSPLLVTLLTAAEEVGVAAGVPRKSVRTRALPILNQTLRNYAALGSAGALSGPLVRGDIETVRKHLDVLRKLPLARGVYLSLGQAALQYLPVSRRAELEKLLGDKSNRRKNRR